MRYVKVKGGIRLVGKCIDMPCGFCPLRHCVGLGDKIKSKLIKKARGVK